MIPRHIAQKTAIAITDTVVILKVESTWEKKMSDKNVSFITEKFHCYWHPKINNAHYSFKIFRLFPGWLHFPGYYFITNWRLPYLRDAGNISSMRRFIKIMICHRSISFSGAAAQSVQPSLFLGEMKREMQQRIQRGARPLPPLFLDQTEARRAEKKLGGHPPSSHFPLYKGLDDLPTPLISRSGSGTEMAFTALRRRNS